MKRTFTFLLMAVLLVSVFALTASAEENPRLLYKTSLTNDLRDFATQTFQPNYSQNIYLYYGTISGTQTALMAGNLSVAAEDSNFLAVEKHTNGDRDVLIFKNCGTAMLIYNDGSVTYTAEVTVALPSNGWYTQQNRSAAYYRASYTLPQNGETVLWYMSEKGFAANDLQTISAQWSNGESCDEGVSWEKVERDGTGKYDLKVTFAPEKLTRPSTNSSSFRLVINSKKGQTISLKLPEIPTLLYKTNLNNSAQTLSSYTVSPGTTPNIYLYYGTTTGTQTPLTAGTLTSDNESVLTVERNSDGVRYKLTPNTFGKATLTYEEGNIKYTAKVTVGLPGNGWFNARSYSEGNYITSYTLPRKGMSTLWYMSKNGFSDTQIQNLSAVWRQNSTDTPCGNGVTATAVERAGEKGKYDFKVTFDSSVLELPSSNSRLKLIYTNSNGSSTSNSSYISVQWEKQPELLYKTDLNSSAQTLSKYTFTLGTNPDIYLYCGTTTGMQTPLTAGTLTSNNESVLTVERNGDRYRLLGQSEGKATLTYTDGSVTYTADVTVLMPDSEALYLDDCLVGFSYQRAQDITMIYETGGFSQTQAGFPTGNEPYRVYGPDFSISAAQMKTDDQGVKYYELLPGNKAKLTVSKIWIEQLSGEEMAFSLSDKAYVSEIVPNEDGSGWKLYSKYRHEAAIRLCASVSLSIQDETVSGVIAVICRSGYTPLTEYDCTELGVTTVAGLKSLLESIAAGLDPNVQDWVQYTVKLAAVDYVGQVIIPKASQEGTP